MVDKVHLLDTLLKRSLNIIKIFSPEHGFRGKADAGEKIDDIIDLKTKLQVVSLYGKNKKPQKVDVLQNKVQSGLFSASLNLFQTEQTNLFITL